MSSRIFIVGIFGSLLFANFGGLGVSAEEIDFTNQIRPILSNKCFLCHGPNSEDRESELRLDVSEAAYGEGESGETAIVPGKPELSEVIRRITAEEEDEHMPPVDTGRKLTQDEIDLLTEWVRQGAKYAGHWSYQQPVRPELPTVKDKSWPRNAIDHFVYDRLQREGLKPSPEADRYALIRRVSLDLTGLPPTLDEVDDFVADSDPQAYEKLVDRLLSKTSYGEHWGRMWLDLARYADSAGYADDPPRTIWGYRDYVIRSINANKPFDQFTIEQLAGDLLPNPTNEQLAATAFHRNTLTNNEGGTNDEEFRNVAVVDRVNTTMAVWMGTTITCAQCHNHKYDPISQKEFFQLFAILNQSEDADKKNEAPLLNVESAEQYQQKAALREEVAALQRKLETVTPELTAARVLWEQRATREKNWLALVPQTMMSDSGAKMTTAADGTVDIARGGKTDVYTLEFPYSAATLGGLRLDVLADAALPNQGPGHADGNFVVSHVGASIVPPTSSRPTARFVRIEVPGKDRILSLAEVQVFNGEVNVAAKGAASQSSTGFNGPAALAIDGNTDGNYEAAKSTTHTAISANPWWEIDLKTAQPIDRIVLWNRTDNGLHTRLANFRITALDEQRKTSWTKEVAQPPNPSAEYTLSGARGIEFVGAYADWSQSGFEAANVLDASDPNKGWAIGPQIGKPHWLTLAPAAAIEVPKQSKLLVTIRQVSKQEHHTVARLRISTTSDLGADLATTPPDIARILQIAKDERNEADRDQLAQHFLTITPQLQPARDRLAVLKKQLAEVKPYTTVPIMRELPEGRRRKTHIQIRGNYLDKGEDVTAGLPSAFVGPPSDAVPNRLTLAKWLVDDSNPLTPRVIANRYWEAIFGIGIVRTSEEFGSQGDLPSHPRLLDWLATELIAADWDTKHLVRLLVTSAAYRQTARVTPELIEKDPNNRLLARGPRFRLSAEMIRDQALFVGGLLSGKLYGPPTKPPQPTLGVKAAFGGGIDWTTSKGEDRYRRGMYTTWRRSNPYPSMAAFDAPNREVCTIRRDRTNTPIQAFVTLNDPVYVEAAQALARRIVAEFLDAETSADDGAKATLVENKARYGFRVCLARHPTDAEAQRLVALYETAYDRFSKDPSNAQRLATNPLGPAEKGSDIAELAAWTLVGNVIMNLDEMMMKR